MRILQSFVLLALLGGSAAPVLRAQQNDAFIVIVNAENGAESVAASDLSRIFLKRQNTWPGGRLIVAVDLSPASPTRKAFTESIHGRPVRAVVAFWRQQIFSGGDLPPAEKERDADVLELVRTTRDAIGYVSPGTRLGPGVRAIQIRR